MVCLFSSAFNGYGLSIKKVSSWGLLWFWDCQFSMWGTEALYSETLALYKHVYNSELANSQFGYTLDRVMVDFFMMVVIGSVFRVVAYFAMISLNRDKQK